MVKRRKILKECEYLNKWFEKKLIKRNQNVILATTGQTGSGKSYCNHTIAYNWYKYYFKKDYPVGTNTCFSVSEVMKLLNSGNLERGELIILEEAGILLNSLDFQNRISKLFSFVLQSFRSMNIGLIINLPVLSMLNKSCRLLLHAHFITSGINYQTKTVKVKPFFHQLNQQTGKSYWKYPWIKVKIGEVLKRTQIRRFNFSLPPDYIINIYEPMKTRFVSDLNEGFVKELDELEKETQRKLARKDLTNIQMDVFKMLQEGLLIKEIAEKRGVSLRSVYEIIERIKNKGYSVEYQQKP